MRSHVARGETLHAGKEDDPRRRRSTTPSAPPGRRIGARTRGGPGAHRPALDVVRAKIRVPALRPGVVARPALVDRLRREAADVVGLVAPAGYGKTTLLAQWAAAEERPVAWLTLDLRDNDPAVFLV